MVLAKTVQELSRNFNGLSSKFQLDFLGFSHNFPGIQTGL